MMVTLNGGFDGQRSGLGFKNLIKMISSKNAIGSAIFKLVRALGNIFIALRTKQNRSTKQTTSTLFPPFSTNLS